MQRCIEILGKHRIATMYDVIVDNPYETAEDWQETVDLVNSLPKTAYIFFYSLTFFKNTALYHKAQKNGFDVKSHLNKSEAVYNQKSLESVCIRLSLHFPKWMVFRLIHLKPKPISNTLLYILNNLAKLVLEPFRFLKLAYLSQQKDIFRFCRLLSIFGKGFLLKILFPGRLYENKNK